jgi:hypothetical protein
MPRSVKQHGRPRAAERRPRRRAPWAALLALVVAYACLLGLSPVGQAGFLWLHLATEHHDSAVRHTAHRHDGEQAHRHAAAVESHEADGVREHGEHGHEHAAADAHSAEDGAGRSVSPGAPHEHNGRVHTHDQTPVEDPAVPVGTLSKYYLPPEVKSPPPTARDAAVPPSAAPAPRRAAFPVDTPPPRRPG